MKLANLPNTSVCGCTLSLRSFFFSGNHGSKFQDVYVSLSGCDSDSCGSPRQPCKSIAQAVRQVKRGGSVHLDGTGTEQYPYDCSLYAARDYRPGICINKSLSFKSYNSAPHVSCMGGFYFQNYPGKQQKLTFEMSGIVFLQTPLRFEDCSDVKILNCSFRDGSTALTIYIRKITNFTLDIRGWSLFWNNSLCIQLILFYDTTIQDRYVAVNVIDTYFLENGLHIRGRSEIGVIKILAADVAKGPSKLQLDISCYKVTCIGNHGYFIYNNIGTAVTREIYNNITLKHNQATSSDFSVAKPKSVRSLYHSLAKVVFAKFIAVNCVNNTLVRCITVLSDHAKIYVQNSQFLGQSIAMVNSLGGCLLLKSNSYVSLAISDTTFTRNKAKAGGAIYVNCRNGIVKLNFINVRFTRCSSIKYGCALFVISKQASQPKSNLSPYGKLDVTFRKVQVKLCSGITRHGKCRAVVLLVKRGTVNVEKSLWSDNLQSANGALFVEARGGRVDVQILHCIFMDNGATKRTGAVIGLLASKIHSGNATIVNNSFINNNARQSKAIEISGKYHIKLANLTVVNYWMGLNIPFPGPWKGEVSIYIDNCKFIDNIKDIYIYLRDPNSVQVVIQNTFLTTSHKTEIGEANYALRVVIPPLKNIKASSAVIKLDNNTFDSKPSSGFALFFKGTKNVVVSHTTFRNCVCIHRKQWRKNPSDSEGSFRETATGGISILTDPGIPLQLGCVQSNVVNDTHPRWSYDSHVFFEDTNFIDNLGLLSGAVYLSHGNTTFKRCSFQDNFANQSAGHVYSAYGTGQVNFIDCSFKKKKDGRKINETLFNKARFFYSESEGPVHFKNTTMVSKVVGTETYAFSVFEISIGGFVIMDENSTIRCNRGFYLELENNTHFIYTEKNKSDCRKNVTFLKYSCKLCGPGYYSLLKGVSRGVHVASTIHCLSCPFGANCVQRNIAAKPNFWGYRTSNNPPSLKFFACPEHYCKRPPSSSTQYNSCHGKRTGILCGECSPGYSETLLSTECRKITECNNFLMWMLTTLVLTTVFVLYLLIKPPILKFLGTHIFWFRERAEEEMTRDLGQVHEHSDNGYLKITFYFYQAAELLVVGSADNLLNKVPFVYAVVAAFNFKVRSVDNGIGCPIPGITVVTKELLLSATVLFTIAEVAILFCVHFVFNIIRQKESPSLFHYMAVVLEILLLGYERLAETSLKLLHCVSIGSEKRLFFNAEVLCWQWWQYIILAYIGVFIVPFIAVLYYGSSKLYKASISAREFLGACIIPLPYLMYWLIKRMLKREGESSESRQNNKDVLEVLHGPFRQPNEHDKGTLYWESVLIGRRFILLSCHAFIATPMFRMVCMAGACVIMLLHHVLKNPYRDPVANKAETLSLLSLVMMADINLAKATLISFGTSTDGPAKSYVEILEWAEVGALAFVPTLLSIFVTFAIVSQLVRLMVTLAKIISRCVRWPRISLRLTRELERPLLEISEEE